MGEDMRQPGNVAMNSKRISRSFNSQGKMWCRRTKRMFDLLGVGGNRVEDGIFVQFDPIRIYVPDSQTLRQRKTTAATR